MITIQEIHRYILISSAGGAPEFYCPIYPQDGPMSSWVTKDGTPCFWCIACNAKLFPSEQQIEFIKSLLNP